MIRPIVLLCSMLAAVFAQSPKPPVAEPPNQAPAAAPGAERAADFVLEAKSALVAGNLQRALTLIEKGIKAGDAEALYLKATMLETGRGLDKNLAQAADLYKRGMVVGHLDSQFAYARFLSEGLGGVPKDEARAKALIKSCAEKGVPGAMVRQAVELLEGSPTFEQEKTAFGILEKASQKGNAEAYLLLAGFYDHGRAGVAKDESKATLLIREAANLGSVVAANEMGVRYQRGTGIVQDNVAAIGWFNLAAQKGLPAALVNLGHCYETGNGVVPDFVVAANNYSVAARQNYPMALHLLGSMAERGAGIKADLRMAYAYFHKAAKLGHPESKTKAEEIKGKLTPEQLAQAENMAE